MSAAAWTPGGGRAGRTAIGLASRNGNVAVKEMQYFGAAIGGGDADMRDAFADTDGAGQPNGRGATDADDAVSFGDTLHSIVDDLGFDVDNSGVEDMRVEVGDESLDTAGRRHARRAGDNQRSRQAQVAELGGQADNGTGTVDDAGGRCG